MPILFCVYGCVCERYLTCTNLSISFYMLSILLYSISLLCLSTCLLCIALRLDWRGVYINYLYSVAL